MGLPTLLSLVGERFRNSYFGSLILLTFEIVGSLFQERGNRKSSFSSLISQIYFTGVEILPHVALLALFIGALTVVQAVTLMPKIGEGDAFGGLMVAVVVRELGPLITALFIAGRTGSALSTYIGNMNVLQEIDALKSMGINHIQYQIMPAFFGTMISLFCLTMVFNLVAILGGYGIVGFLNVINPDMFSAHFSFGLFIEKIFLAFGAMDAVFGVIKPLLFGAFVAVVACFHGLAVERDVRNVPKATRLTVVRTFVLIIVADLMMAFPFLLQVSDNIII